MRLEEHQALAHCRRQLVKQIRQIILTPPKAALQDLAPTPPGISPGDDIQDAITNKSNQRIAIAAVYYGANALRLAAPIAEVAAKAIPVVGWIVLGGQLVHAGYEGYEALKQSRAAHCGAN